jgi:creatinine amidohydrolase
MEPKIQFELMTPSEIVEARQRCPIAFVPISPIEWHGPHLPLGTDGLIAHHLALRVCAQTGGVVLPPYFVGTETVLYPGTGPGQLQALGFTGSERIVGMDYPKNSVKSLYFEESAFGITAREIVRLLKAEPYKLIVLMNFHGAQGQIRTLTRIALEETVEGQVHVKYHPSRERPRRTDIDPGHAERWETSMVMAIHEQHVRLDALPPLDQPMRYTDFGIVEGRAFAGNPTADFNLSTSADPRYSSREEGEALIDAVVSFTVENVRQQLAEVQ